VMINEGRATAITITSTQVRRRYPVEIAYLDADRQNESDQPYGRERDNEWQRKKGKRFV